jgi:hypothetical protein
MTALGDLVHFANDQGPTTNDAFSFLL